MLAISIFVVTIIVMKIEYDINKNLINIKKHGVSFDDVAYFDFSSAIFEVDTRFDYGEKRINTRCAFIQ